MASEYFAAGGFGMYPVSIFGFFLVVACVLYALRPRPGHARLGWLLGALTLMAGWLGTATGICNSAFYIQHVEQPKQLEILALGVQESLHDMVLALIFGILAGLIAMVGLVREMRAKAA